MPPVLLFPAHGCPPAGSVTQDQMDQRLRNTRQTLRRHWQHEGVKAAVELLEMKAAWLLRESLAPAAGEFGRGVASGACQLAETLRNVILTVEDEPSQTE